jgi:hypothetical protein
MQGPQDPPVKCYLSPTTPRALQRTNINRGYSPRKSSQRKCCCIGYVTGVPLLDIGWRQQKPTLIADPDCMIIVAQPLRRLPFIAHACRLRAQAPSHRPSTPTWLSCTAYLLILGCSRKGCRREHQLQASKQAVEHHQSCAWPTVYGECGYLHMYSMHTGLVASPHTHTAGQVLHKLLRGGLQSG